MVDRRCRNWLAAALVVIALSSLTLSSVTGKPDVGVVDQWALLKSSDQGSSTPYAKELPDMHFPEGSEPSGPDGRRVRLSGYLMPVETNGDTVRAYVFAPWFGICSHAPQPLADRAIYVVPEEPLKQMKAIEHITVSGRLGVGLRHETLFIGDGQIRISLGYELHDAVIERSAPHPVSPVAADNPWKSMLDGVGQRVESGPQDR